MTTQAEIVRDDHAGRRLKVLHVFKTYPPDTFGGIERVIHGIIRFGRAFGIDGEVFTVSPSPEPAEIDFDSVRVFRARQDAFVASTGLSLSAFRRFRDRVSQADVIHYHFPWPFMDLLHLAHGRGRPAIVTYHSDIVRQSGLLALYRPLMMRFLALQSAIVATSPNYIETSPVLRQFPLVTEVVPIGIDADPGSIDAALRTSFAVRLPPRFFLFVGVLRYYKGVSFLIEAARQSGLPIVLVGDGEERAAIERAGLPNLHMVGAVGDAEKAVLLDLCCGFIFPSHLRSEAFGVALLEAARAGRPMISCAMGTGTDYVNIDGETGITVPPADPPALASAMTRIWDNAELAAAMGRAARERFEALFRAERMAGAYASIYRRVAKAPG
ncbi:glycosyltransferase [Tardiphaga sp. 285_C5_N1_2]|uniref:glycosyltransferase n=1 Tax=Tardiphaga sp. 285_C5_N1_2 TaxID=3240775 RepID=UPI003F8B7B23